MAEHLTPEKIEQGGKLLAELAAAKAEWHETIRKTPAPRPTESATVLRRLERAEDSASSFAVDNAQAILAAAELGMAWEAEAKAARAWCERDTLDTRATEVTRAAYLKAMDHTDQLTGRIGE